MNYKPKSRDNFIHLYNPKDEGLGMYDLHYINAQKKHLKNTLKRKESDSSRYAA